MSDNVVNDSPAAHTRRRHPELGRQSFEPISERMRRNKSDSREDLHGEPVRSSPRSPGRARKNQSKKSSGSPQFHDRSPRQQRRKLYSELEKQTRLYPKVPGDDDSDDDYSNNESDLDDYDEFDSASYADDGRDRSGSPVTKKYTVKKRLVHTPRDARHTRKYEYDRPEQHIMADNTNAQAQNNVIGLLILAFGIIAIVLGIAMFFLQKSIDEPTEKSVDYFKLYKPSLDQIRAKYPSQSPRFWKVVSSSLKRLLTERVETYPAVMMFGIPDPGSETGTCLSKDIIKSLNDFFNSTEDGYIYSGSLNSDSSGKMKQDLDDKLIRYLGNGKGVVLDHIEKLPAQVALLLHAYCDGDNAPYKDAAIILGLHSSKHLSDRDDLIEGILNGLWERELGIDEMPALRSRIANSITVVTHEPNIKC